MVQKFLGARDLARVIHQVRNSATSFAVKRVIIYLPDPNTQAWLKGAMDPVFGFPKIVRFSWATVKVILENNAHKVKW